MQNIFSDYNGLKLKTNSKISWKTHKDVEIK